jgi:hypothetical protein
MSDIEKYNPEIPLDKQDFMKKVGNLYGPDLFPSDWDAEQKALAEKELLEGGMMPGMWAKIPKTCRQECPLNLDKTCKLSKKPFGKLCPEEKAYTEFLVRYYIQSLEIHEEDIASISLIRDLVDVEIQLMRLAKIKANQDFTIDQLVSFGMNGEEITQIQENPIHNVDAKLAKRKQDILKLLAATREAKAKLIGVVAQVTTAQKISQLMQEVERSILIGKNYGGEYANGDIEFVIDGPISEEE